jgi:hypothetical protein
MIVNTINNRIVSMRATKIASGAYVKNIIDNRMLPNNITNNERTCFRTTNLGGNRIVTKYRAMYAISIATNMAI